MIGLLPAITSVAAAVPVVCVTAARICWRRLRGHRHFIYEASAPRNPVLSERRSWLTPSHVRREAQVDRGAMTIRTWPEIFRPRVS